jgi:hypothetical protein
MSDDPVRRFFWRIRRALRNEDDRRAEKLVSRPKR